MLQTLATVEGSVAGSKATSRELEKLFEELDNLSDSGGELDNVSQVITVKYRKI